MSNLNPQNLTIHDLISYLDSVAIREETQLILLKSRGGSLGAYGAERQQKRTNVAQFLLKLAKQAAAAKEPNTYLSLLTTLPESNNE